MGPVAAEGTGGDHGGPWGPMVPMVPMGTQAPAWTWGMGIAIPMSQFQAGTRACLTQTVTGSSWNLIYDTNDDAAH